MGGEKTAEVIIFSLAATVVGVTLKLMYKFVVVFGGTRRWPGQAGRGWW